MDLRNINLSVKLFVFGKPDTTIILEGYKIIMEIFSFHSFNLHSLMSGQVGPANKIYYRIKIGFCKIIKNYFKNRYT